MQEVLGVTPLLRDAANATSLSDLLTTFGVRPIARRRTASARRDVLSIEIALPEHRTTAMSRLPSLRVFATLVPFALAACSAKGGSTGFGDPDGGGFETDSGGSSGALADGGVFGGDGGKPAPPDGSVTVTTTIYGNTDDSLFTLDPKSHAVTLVGKFTGNGSESITDVAVNGNGEVFVNSTASVYKATLPSGAGTVQLAKLAVIAGTGQKFYALAFAPAGVLGADEALVGGDGDGELWLIDGTNGAIKDLGGFGNDPRTDAKHKGHILALSGDLVFYNDASNKPTGLATIRSCTSKGTGCETTDDILVGVDMAALAAASKGAPAASLLSGYYGGSGSNPGNGIGFGDVFGLGVWGGEVYGFTRNQSSTPPTLLTIDTTTGKGAALAGASFSFTNGWSGAGVTTKVTVTVPPPPPVR